MKLEYPYKNFYELLKYHATTKGDKKALFIGKRSYTYKELLNLCDSFANYLVSIDIKPEDKVALFLRNSLEYVVSVFAISKVGAITVPVNTFLKSEELSYILEDSDAKVLVASSQYKDIVLNSIAPESCDSIVWEGKDIKSGSMHISFDKAILTENKTINIQRELEDLAVFFYTSGTTGNPKGAMLTYKNIFSNAASATILFNINPKDRSIIFLPMFHSFTFSIGMMLLLYAGGSIVIIESIRPFSNIFKQTLLKRVTLFFGVPDVYRALSKAKLPWYFMWFHKIRIFVSGAAPLQESVLKAMQDKFKKTAMLEGYGLSESSPAACINPLHKQKIGSVGPAMPGYNIKIVDDNYKELPQGEIGEIVICGDNVMKGYYRRLEATKEAIRDGCLLTGDLGYLDSDGYLFIVDRKKDLIITKGINVYPKEIESNIDVFPGVKQSAVIGIPDDKSGEVPIAYLEPEEGESIDTVGLKKYLKEILADYKVPKAIYVIEELPKNATGKVLKRELRARHQKGKSG